MASADWLSPYIVVASDGGKPISEIKFRAYHAQDQTTNDTDDYITDVDIGSDNDNDHFSCYD